ncbi:ANPEP [Mytilus edulis]|uniref:ANPEP n=1 Tax=Mytilus edulis TaxID=6550 RepID=A0A8S3TAC8_MYTED|nr:ANPEP [Mytilus edulis]
MISNTFVAYDYLQIVKQPNTAVIDKGENPCLKQPNMAATDKGNISRIKQPDMAAIQKGDISSIKLSNMEAIEKGDIARIKQPNMANIDKKDIPRPFLERRLVCILFTFQDIIGVPDFKGSMENWGLIIQREEAMSFTPQETAEGFKEYVTMILSRELAHVWFGNLVSQSWWDDLWLIEGFANYMAFVAMNSVVPSWLPLDDFVIKNVQRALAFDGLISSHPVHVPVSNPDELDEKFDSISFRKGGSILRMLQFILGDATFQKGLQRLIREREYGVMAHDDLWAALRTQSIIDGNSYQRYKEYEPLDVKGIMETWTLQMNYPTVFMERKGYGMRLSQSRYLLDKTATDPGQYASPFGSGDLSKKIALQTLEYLSMEDSYFPFYAALTEITYVRNMLERTDIYDDLVAFLSKTFSSPLIKLGYSNTGSGRLEILLRELVLREACRYGDQNCINFSINSFQNLMTSPGNTNPIDAEFRSIVYYTAVQYGGVTEWEYAYRGYTTSNSGSERLLFLYSCAYTRNVTILNRILTDAVRKQDGERILRYVSRNPIGNPLVWNLITSNWDVLITRFVSVNYLIADVTAKFNTEADIQSIQAFKDSQQNLGASTAAFDRAIETTRANIKWMNSNFQVIKDWLKNLP